MSAPRIRFLGAADTVTGSRYLVESGERRLLVDCGLFQGLKRLRLRNWASFPVSPESIDAVVLTHAHLDHSGWLPRLVRDGFRGPVYCTYSTIALCGLLLPDSAYLEEEEAARANRYGYTRHRPALPLYTREDAARALEHLRPVTFDREVELLDGWSLLPRRAGHILGAATMRVGVAGRTLTFSGDIGRPSDPLLPPPHPFEGSDALVVESTYGDREHPSTDAREQLAAVIRRTASRGGVVVVPAFAVGRAQQLLHHLAELRRVDAIPSIPIFMDSPMAADATRHFLASPADHRLRPDEVQRMRSVATITNSVEESKSIDRRTGPMVVVSASGMATGGRVLHHLVRFAPDARNTILLVGHQAAGTRGASLAEGARRIKIHGAYVDVAAEVVRLDGLSAHAGASELIEWLRGAERAPGIVFVTHGEPEAADALRLRIQDELGWNARVPEHSSAHTVA